MYEGWVTFENILLAVQSVAICISLIFTALSYRKNSKLKSIQFEKDITNQHREVWSKLIESNKLNRVQKEDVDLECDPVTEEEKQFVVLAVQHFSLSFKADKIGIKKLSQEAKKDMAEFLSLPIPKSVWYRIRSYQDDPFRKMIDKNLCDLSSTKNT